MVNRFKTLAIAAVVFSTAVLGLFQSAQAQVPAQADPGRVQGGMQNQWYTQQYWPFWGRPINDADLTPYESEEPVIQFLNMDVQGTLAPKNAPTEEETGLKGKSVP